MEVYPKGVCFQRAIKVYEGTEVPERVIRTVRVSVIKPDKGEVSELEEATSLCNKERRVRLGVLVMSDHDGFEHVRKVVTRNYFFSPRDQVGSQAR